MKRSTAGLLAAVLTLPSVVPSAAPAWAAEPFEEVVLPSAKKKSHTLAYGSMITGASLIGASFILRDRANERYDAYLIETEPDEITRLFDETRTLDRLSSSALIGGEALLALGIYLRFVHRSGSDRVSFNASPTRCAVSLHF